MNLGCEMLTCIDRLLVDQMFCLLHVQGLLMSSGCFFKRCSVNIWVILICVISGDSIGLLIFHEGAGTS